MTDVGDSVLRINGHPIAAITKVELDAHFAALSASIAAAVRRKRALGTDCPITREIDRSDSHGHHLETGRHRAAPPFVRRIAMAETVDSIVCEFSAKRPPRWRRMVAFLLGRRPRG